MATNIKGIHEILSNLWTPLKDDGAKTFSGLNQKSVSGNIYSTDLGDGGLGDVKDFIDNGDLSSNYTMNLISIIKMWHTQNFIYSGQPDEIDTAFLETQLFLWGKLAFFILDGKLVFSSFVIGEKDIYGLPKTIQPELKNGKKIKDKTVDVDCVLVYNDDSFLYFKTFYGTIWRIWGFLGVLSRLDKEIKANFILNRNYIPIDVNSSDEYVATMTREITNGGLFIKVNSADMNQNPANKNKVGAFALEDKTDTLWQNHDNYLSLLKTAIGCDSNAMPDKKERQLNAEIQVNNKLANAVLQNQIDNRKKGFERLNKVLKMNITVELNTESDDILPENEKTDMNSKVKKETK